MSWHCKLKRPDGFFLILPQVWKSLSLRLACFLMNRAIFFGSVKDILIECSRQYHTIENRLFQPPILLMFV
ncbi:hypothetical protein HJG54_02755 [Leptolyngbya sp. NK1-12]|uniref:Uncharacterized protein n=1 Tax=Leptolyngbya sp. NK1-12 TaxID=2547451 RepID=A0AA96WB37_9CYAN|nr:hypothetical protein [Leptolyngbya sp. NK1-12]WNZ21893.1 hypothetical protein HJG54_02755 [Leptolyngbya sp. NK1-12]